jgi:hypothetical protein
LSRASAELCAAAGAAASTFVGVSPDASSKPANPNTRIMLSPSHGGD